MSLRSIVLHTLGIGAMLGMGQNILQAGIIQVPSDYGTIQEAINAAQGGDTILLSPGTYHENPHIVKNICLASEFLFSGESSDIDKTILDGGTASVLRIAASDGEACSIVGITIRNGEDGILASSPFHLLHCRITGCKDGIDYENGSGGTCRNNEFFNNLDDGIDLDGSLSEVVIENNIIRDNEDDGIEIRLHAHQGDTLHCLIRNNLILRNQEDGIQFIDYPDTSQRHYLVKGNLIHDNRMAGIAFMDQGETKEDYRAASIPESIHIINNTFSGHEYGFCGGGNVLSLNNIFLEASIAGVMGMDASSILAYCLFHANATDLDEIAADTIRLISGDPGLDQNFRPDPGSICIDAGATFFMKEGDTLIHIGENEYTGEAPDLGAYEYQTSTRTGSSSHPARLSAYPNPFENQLYLSWKGEGDDSPGKLHLINMEGKVLLDLDTQGRQDAQLDLSRYPAGIYFLKAYQQSAEILQIVKQ